MSRNGNWILIGRVFVEWRAGIDECSDERGGACAEAGSCTNRLVVSETPYRVVTNTSSMVGVEARTVAECVCQADARPPPPGLASCAGGPPCLNGGQCTGLPHAPCKCPDGKKIFKKNSPLPYLALLH